tara:strand:- start:3297 stop:4862 length:1566 start_codon:yes stop_codon:yes gene_type:complete
MPEFRDKKYDIDKLHLHTPNLMGQPMNLMKLMVDVVVEENLYRPFINGSITIMDKGGYFEIFPILGEEYLEIFITSPNDERPLSGFFRVYEASPLVRGEGNPGATFTLYFASVEYFISKRTKIYDSYLGAHKASLSYIVKQVYDNYIKNTVRGEGHEDYKKDIIVEDTLRQYQIMFPNRTPFQAINMCAKRALSKSRIYKGATFVFYEELDAFHFESIEGLVDKVPKLILIYSPNLNADADSKETLGDSQLQLQDDDLQTQKVESFEVVSNFDVLDNIQKGMYSSRLVTYDFERMKYREYDYEYVPQKADKDVLIQKDGQQVATTVKAGKEGDVEVLYDRSKAVNMSGKLCTHNNDNLNHPLQKIHLHSTTLNHDFIFDTNQTQAGGFKEKGIIPSSVEELLLQRFSQFQQLSNIKVRVNLAKSNMAIKVGDVVEFQMPSEIASEVIGSTPPEVHFYYGGKYIVTKTVRNISGPGGMQTMLELSKNSLDNPMPDFDPAVLAKNQIIGDVDENDVANNTETI